MIKVICHKTFGFDHPTLKNPKNKTLPLRVVAKADNNFHELPEWVAKTDLFKLASQEGSIQAFHDNSDSGKVGKLYEEEAALKERIRALKEEQEMLESANKNAKTSNEPIQPDTRKYTGRKTKKPNYPKIGDTMPERSQVNALGLGNPKAETKNAEECLVEE